ncbi:MAG: isocitrate dehydrogenase (NAD(+)) [Deltaproteobacteria bacterium]|nr:isocitrate dehydrogenase (NAD(+)) [Deltaproteobacteria bacterium]
MTYKVSLIAGDGIGPEITQAAREVIQASGVKIVWDEVLAGQKAIETCGQPLPDATLRSIKKNGVALKGPLATAIGKGFPSINVMLRKQLHLYANVRPAKSMEGIVSRYKNVDLVILRENTEDLYSGIEHFVAPGVVESIKVITRKASLRIAEFAFDYARKNKRKKITAIHKANIMKLSDGLFLDCARKVARKFPKIEYNEMIVDNACMQLVLKPHQFDILLLENLYGDIVSDLAAGLVGGLGVVPAANIGEKGAIFEAVHGTAPDIAGKNKANPIALTLSGALMLDYLGESSAAQKIRKSVGKILKKGRFLTPDLGGTATTSQMTETIIREM